MRRYWLDARNSMCPRHRMHVFESLGTSFRSLALRLSLLADDSVWVLSFRNVCLHEFHLFPRQQHLRMYLAVEYHFNPFASFTCSMWGTLLI